MMEQTIIDVEQGIKNLLLLVEQLRGEKAQLSQQLGESRELCEKLELSLMEQEDKHAMGEQRMHALLSLLKDAAEANVAPAAPAAVAPAAPVAAPSQSHGA